MAAHVSLEERIYSGDRAREVLENEAYQNAMEAIKQEIREQWEASPARDVEGREKLWTMLKLADKLERALQSTLETGKLAKAELEHQRTMAERARDWLRG